MGPANTNCTAVPAEEVLAGQGDDDGRRIAKLVQSLRGVLTEAKLPGRFECMSRPFFDQLRDAILQSGLSRAEIERRAGVLQPALCRFLKGRSRFSPASIENLVELLDLELRPRKRTRSKQRSRR